MIAKLIELDEVDSTNSEAMRQAESGAPHGTVVRAEQQHAGKGRRGRYWQSPGGMNLYFSLLLRPSFMPEHASMLTLLMALAVAGAIEDVRDDRNPGIRIKWPNDVVLNHKKVCGILTELKVRPSGAGQQSDTCQQSDVGQLSAVQPQNIINYVVVGVGVNVNMDEIPAELAGKATSLRCEFHREISRDWLLKAIIRHFSELYRVFEINHNLEFIRQEYNQYLAGLGEEVRVLDPQGEYTGISHGITAHGELLVQKSTDSQEAEMIKVYAGEVSVRGSGGYA